MKKGFLYSFIVLMLFLIASCTQQMKKPEGTEYLGELERQKQLEAEQAGQNAQIVDEYSKKKEILTRIEKEDRLEQKKLIAKKEDLEAKSAQLEKEIEEKLSAKSAEITRSNAKVKELMDLGLTPEELGKRLAEETDLTQEEIDEVVSTYRVQQMIASAQSREELEEVLRNETELKDEEIEEIVTIRQQVIDKEKELRKETLKKIHERLVRNRNLNIEKVFCSRASTLDQLILSPIYYPFDVHVVSKKESTELFNEFELISSEIKKYPDMKLQLEGNCDYKGSSRYNKALGDRRWSGVMPLLTAVGLSESRVRGISKGEECPTPRFGSDEEWRAENRRTDFVWVLE